MICKVFGSVLLLTGSGYMAITASRVIEQRVIDLRKLYSLLLQLKSEIQYLGNTLPECFERLSEGAGAPFSVWLTNMVEGMEKEGGNVFSTIWKEQLDFLYHASALELGDVELLKDLSDKLGNQDVSAQLKAIDYALLHMERNRKELENEIKSKKKVITSMSLFVGMLALILLL